MSAARTKTRTNPRDAYARLLSLGVTFMRTAEVAAAARMTPKAASMLLTRLERAGLVRGLRKGVWIIKPRTTPIDRYSAVEALTSPFPSYVSLQTALYLHGLIEQVPAVIYAVTLGETEKVRTTLGVYSLHHISPLLFDGFDAKENGTKLATPEKALFDVAYFSGSKVRLFARVPELELPATFKEHRLWSWTRQIESSRRRSMVKQRLEAFLGQAETAK